MNKETIESYIDKLICSGFMRSMPQYKRKEVRKLYALNHQMGVIYKAGSKHTKTILEHIILSSILRHTDLIPSLLHDKEW